MRTVIKMDTSGDANAGKYEVVSFQSVYLEKGLKLAKVRPKTTWGSTRSISRLSSTRNTQRRSKEDSTTCSKTRTTKTPGTSETGLSSRTYGPAC